MCIIPVAEAKVEVKPIFVIPEGQRLNIGSTEIDFDDTVMIFGLYNIDQIRSVDGTAEQLSPVLSCEMDILYGTLEVCNPDKV